MWWRDMRGLKGVISFLSWAQRLYLQPELVPVTPWKIWDSGRVRLDWTKTTLAFHNKSFTNELTNIESENNDHLVFTMTEHFPLTQEKWEYTLIKKTPHNPYLWQLYSWVKNGNNQSLKYRSTCDRVNKLWRAHIMENHWVIKGTGGRYMRQLEWITKQSCELKIKHKWLYIVWFTWSSWASKRNLWQLTSDQMD